MNWSTAVEPKDICRAPAGLLVNVNILLSVVVHTAIPNFRLSSVIEFLAAESATVIYPPWPYISICVANVSVVSVGAIPDVTGIVPGIDAIINL